MLIADQVAIAPCTDCIQPDVRLFETKPLLLRSTRPHGLATNARWAEKRHTSVLDGLDQECEMLDVPWVGIVRIESLKMRSEHDLRTERSGIHSHGSIRSRT
jgi:hypothetical protein